MTGVRIRVPATSANLGPAFDCAGLALTCYDVVEFEATDAGLTVEITGDGADSLPRDESHLVVQAFRSACAELGWTPPGLRVAADNGIPQGRGLGSSASAVVAGILGAWALCPDVDGIDDDAVLRLATAIEGHPDNVAPCLLGGATLSWTTDEGARAVRIGVADTVSPVLFVPDSILSTEVARGLLPEVVPHADAAHNAARAALLVHALGSDPALLLEATDDRLHQRQRAAAMPESMELVDRLRAEGHAAVISGAGPSVLVLAVSEDNNAPESVLRRFTPSGWSLLALEIDPAGAAVTPQVSSR
jgi:homoserine kinase